MEIADRKAEIEKLAIQVFGNENKAMKWLRKPMRQLAGKSPLEASEQEDTAQLAFDLLHSLDHGYLG
ncbi:antitoxin Xre/MbcA/ParS toxin-binding domain-containing protein [Thiobacillus sedimenti]|uniref:Antitoxin Xre/MbcA/ParS toxin-binding domain-containing protein n=1 Tax=Thiobacillus sedimenti TaxID=3110231 RepID=A0ABZ1CIM0_9PROT|nr:antitoxin Xre/MbcA/ParS toxin-binding domain-containing protein [Thiobacillus sp. SCUT-2]WRS39238.1 antitoxin Xre/MbcA/ParS toxin-binding domain-containing protein [Thiobacillus sp. SCUT-2]